MKSFFLSCPVCKSMAQEVLFSGFNVDLVDDFQNIVLCEDCGAVFRNPIVPDLNRVHYQTPGSWEGERNHREHEARLAFVSEYIGHRVKLGPGELYIDVGGGPGWLVSKMRALYPHARIVLCEPGEENDKFAKARNPGLITIPARIDELVVADNAFSLVTTTGVDYLFIDHRAALTKLAAMTRNEGFFYIERAVFVEQESYYRHPIFDHDDLFGHNHMMNFWPCRQQFANYIAEFFDIVDHVDYTWVETLGYKCQVLGLLCKKSQKTSAVGVGEGAAGSVNYYSQSLESLKQRAILSSLKDLEVLARSGVKSIAICGDKQEATALRRLIEENRLFEIAQLLSLDAELVGKDGFVALENRVVGTVDAVLVASVASQQKYWDKVKSCGYRGRVLPCFRHGHPRFETITSAGNAIQMKAFLPAYIAGLRTE